MPRRKPYSRAMRDLAEAATWIKMAAIVVVLVGGLYLLGALNVGPFSAATGGGGAGGGAGPSATVVGDSCPSSQTTTIHLAVKNNLNTSAEYLAQKWVVYNSAGGLVGSVTTTAGSAVSYQTVSVGCPGTFKLYPITDDDANSIIRGLLSEDGATTELKDSNGNVIAKVVSDGDATTPDYIEVNAKVSDVYLVPLVDKHSDSVRVRMKDTDLGQWVYAAGASSSTAEQTVSDGSTVYYYTTSSNSTALSVGTGGKVRMNIELSTSSKFLNANDRGILVAIDVGSQKTYWDENNLVVKLGGESGTVLNQFSDKTSEEADRFSDYEWFYLIPADQVIDSGALNLYIGMQAKSDKDPSTNITIALAVRGQYEGQSGGVKVGAAKDDSSNSKVVSEWKIVRVIQ